MDSSSSDVSIDGSEDENIRRIVPTAKPRPSTSAVELQREETLPPTLPLVPTVASVQGTAPPPPPPPPPGVESGNLWESTPIEAVGDKKEDQNVLMPSTGSPLGIPLPPPPPPLPPRNDAAPAAAPLPTASFTGGAPGRTLDIEIDIQHGTSAPGDQQQQQQQQQQPLLRKLSLDGASDTLDIDVSESTAAQSGVPTPPPPAVSADAAPSQAPFVPHVGLPPAFPTISPLPLDQLRSSPSLLPAAAAAAVPRDYGEGVLPLLPSPRDAGEGNKENAAPVPCRPMGTMFFATPTTGPTDPRLENKNEGPKVCHIRRRKSEFEAVQTSFFGDSGDSTSLITSDGPPGKRRSDPDKAALSEDGEDRGNAATPQQRRRKRKPLEEKVIYRTEPPATKEAQSLSSLSTCAISSEQQTPAAKKGVIESIEMEGVEGAENKRKRHQHRHRYEKGSIRYTPGLPSPSDSFRCPRSAVFQSPEEEEEQRRREKEKVAAATIDKKANEMPELATSGGPLSTFKKICCTSTLQAAPTDLGRECRASESNLRGSSLGELLEEQMRQEDSPFSSTPHANIIVTIHRMSELHADGAVVHPFVRVWLVHAKTGRSLLVSDGKVPCGLTQPYDLRTRQCRSPQWEAEISLPIDMDAVREAPKESMLLFELLDCGCESIYGFYMPRQGLYPISWGYFFLHNRVGELHARLDNIHIQMFPCPVRTVWYVQMFQALLPWNWGSDAVYAPSELFLDPHGVLRPESRSTTDLQLQRPSTSASSQPVVPSVFYTFKNLLFRKVPYQGSLVISVRVPKDAEAITRDTDMSAFEDYMLNILTTQSPLCGVPRRSSLSDSPASSLTKYMLSRRRDSQRRWSISLINAETLTQPYDRLEGERTLPPTATLQTCPVSGKVTCMTFSNGGTTLALGVTRHLQYMVELRSPTNPEMPVYAELYGHTGHIHSLAYPKDDTHLISCSSDRTVRVWRMAAAMYNMRRATDVSMASLSATGLVSQNVCVCCLPHAFPVYTAIFHQGHIVTGGYDAKLTVWKYDTAPVDAGPNAKEDSALQLTQNFTPAMQMALSTNANADPYNALDGAGGRPLLLGEQVTQVANESDAIILSLASNEMGHRVWSVSSSGKVCGWRALYEEHRNGHREWQISVTAKQTTDCSGSNAVQVRDRYAIVTCRSAALVYVFDAMSCEQLRVVRTMMPQGTPFTLLPDGLAFVAGGHDGALHCWDCFDGGLCTSTSGYTALHTKFPIADMAWATNQQLAAFCSSAPCAESVVERVLELPAGNVASRPPLQVELTLVSIVGAKRDENTVITSNDKNAGDEFCQRFGGELSAKRRAQLVALRNEARRERAKGRDKERLYNDDDAARTTRVDMGLFMENTLRELPASNPASTSRIDAIIGFWKGLVRQHRHEKPDYSFRNDIEMQERSRRTNRELEFEEEDSLRQ